MEFLIGLIILVLDIIAIVGVIKSSYDGVMKLVWVLVILLLPIIGMILWFVIGAKRQV